MVSNKKDYKHSAQELVMIIFDAAMALAYLAFGIVLLFSTLFRSVFKQAAINDGLRIALGAVLGLYGLFRVYRAVRKFFAKSV